jgi:hypoxanthine phosphoribosyltransferase
MVLKAPTELVRGRTVLLIDGVLDRGVTLTRAKELLEEAGASAIISAVAVAKTYTGRAIKADHALFEAGTEFLYGYGMDRSGLSRGLTDIRVRE